MFEVQTDSHYRDKNVNVVFCKLCGNPTKEYRPIIVNNRPYWACKKCHVHEKS